MPLAIHTKVYLIKELKTIVLVVCISLLFIHLSSSNLYAQDGIFSQLYSAPLYFNPAFASLDNKIDAGINYRTQMFNSNNYSVAQFSFIYPIIIQRQKENEEVMNINHRGAIGLSVFRETLGQNSTLQGNGGLLTMAYNLHLNKEKSARLAVGAQGGYVIRNIEQNNLKWGSQYENLVGFNTETNPSVANIGASKGYPIVNAGLSFVKRIGATQKSDSTQQNTIDKFFYIGGSAAYLNSPNISFLDQNITKKILIRGQAGMDFKMGENMLLSPHVMYQTQDNVHQIYGGLYYYLMFNGGNQNSDNPFTIIAGAWYRHQDAAVGMIGAQYKKYTLGASYDYKLSGINQSNVSNDVLEISFKVRFGIKEKKPEKLPEKKKPVKRYKPMLIL